MDSRGALIVFEGLDRVGKSTQTRMLVNKLCNLGYKAELLEFPKRSTDIGRVITLYLEKKIDLEPHCVHLLFSANRWEHVPLIQEKINKGITLVVDRYSFSGIAYTLAKKKNISLEWTIQSDSGIPKPDMIIFLKFDNVESRTSFGIERYETVDFQNNVMVYFKKLINDKSLYWEIIDASKNINDIHDEITKLSENIIEKVRYTSLNKLWK
ncbi:thymidylate kinase [Cotia virus SPAn232]|uniref:Thymidylate kinase n=2 Tax=Cotia virus TaxID=39444 RepID=H6TAE8_9POXV|nr:thymidylate kinase [Cotia virus SPAn232]YP_005296368.1 thymidylate kinase [Cotia virus SPAn232]AIT70621.1 thymidylate kinase [Cotia virus]AFB76896.1 thymidylate kinase [Cotia virus SPAn232]AFB76982.1 thymidylate kinase [Cotia virus SPAn232]AIT70795.1 thymidylate kinase [Cotia virus]